MDKVTSQDRGATSLPIEPSTYQIKLTERREVAERTVAFYFERPADFTFRAGQFIDLMLLDPPETDSEGNSRAFTIASSPTEDHLMVVTRLRDTAFKRVLMDMPLETIVNIEGPFGKLTLPDSAARPVVFLAGGIGITPFRSILVHAAANHLPHRLVLFYSNRRPEDAPFLQELHDLQRKNLNYTFIPTMTNQEKPSRPWAGETGYLDHELLTRHFKGIESPLYYVVGPPGMVDSVRIMLVNAGVRKTDIRTEEFVGYLAS